MKSISILAQARVRRFSAQRRFAALRFGNVRAPGTETFSRAVR
jgi:hypothetical protein